MRVQILRKTIVSKRSYIPGESVDLPEGIARGMIQTGTACLPGQAPSPADSSRGGGPKVEHAALDHPPIPPRTKTPGR